MNKLGLVVGLLEDDQDMAALVGQWLEEAGYATRLFRSVGEYRRRQGSEAVDLLLLDWMLPDGSGIEVIEGIRSSANSRLPVVFLTARDSEDDIVRGLASGGDDYVVKPPKRRELIARVSVVLRRHGADAEAAETIDLAPYSLDAKRRRISVDGREVDLTQREFDLASFLFRRHGRIVSRDALLENVWNLSSAVSTRTVDTHVSRLRKKLELSGEHGWRLAAIYQHGYRLEQI
ncbi:DNA-binding response OmpR family regulator [Dokdonella fugitiva]|jgi:DNA-binding response OmpR family regulator|uniref:DNA-binding response OmpR family regulator n=1 Tax=Dokdonella fugitiva TaxID=328517 RepID=A0A839EZA5_9GAMM|nr:response regulator transcription factor [Dokdonella fugitiva]MBA8889135.1 DNA-binding response OmpR family regulator [Dokdonella fugitiva]